MVFGSDLPQEFVMGNSFPCQALGMLKLSAKTETQIISVQLENCDERNGKER